MTTDPSNDTPDPESLLRDEFRAPPFPAERVRARIDRTIRANDAESALASERSSDRLHPRGFHRAAWPLRIAAGFLLLVTGVGIGMWIPDGAPDRVPEAPQVALAHAIQGSGSAWVAELARLGAEDADALTPDERAIAIEVAWAAFRAAAVEFARQPEFVSDPGALIALVHTPPPTSDHAELRRTIRF